MKKTIGYVVAAIGIASLALGTSAKLINSIKIPLLSSIPSLYLTGAGVILIVFGVSLMLKKPKHKEVPIYKGKDIVGYRRQK